MDPASTIFVSWLLKYRYLAIFPLTVIEGPIVTVLIGFFVSLNVFNPLLAFAVIVAGDLIGDALHYSVGRWGGRSFLARWGRFIGLPLKKIEPLERAFAKQGNKLLFTGKMLHGIGGAFLVAAGLVHMPFRDFILSNFWATLAKSAILLIIGYSFGQGLTHIKSLLDALAFGTAAAAALSILIYFFYLRGRSKNS